MPRKANPALMRPYKVSAELEAVIGPGPLPRGQVMKKIWEYIKAKKKVNMFEMAKLLSAHLTA